MKPNKVLIGLAAVFLIFIGAVLMQPAQYRVERSITIAAPPAAVYPWVADFKKFDQWSPWEKLDPAMKKTFSGPDTGVGSRYEWSGNDDVGTGSMTVTAAKEGESLTMDLEFVEPWQSKAETGFALAADGEGTKVTWTMSGDNDFMGKAMGLFMDMEGMIGKDYDEGLSNLKKKVESASPAA